ncbi:cilia- and flagella-associated protein 184 [Chlamydotis macqueenii]
MEAPEAARSDGTGPEGPEGPAGRSELSPGAPGEPPGPEVLHGPGEPGEPRPEEPLGPEEPKPCEPDQPGLEEVESRHPEPPGPEEPGLQEPGPEEPEQPGPEELEQPGLEELEPSEPEPPGPEEPGLEEPGPGEPEQPGLEEPEETGLEKVEPCEREQPGPEEPGLEAAEPCEREEPGLEEVEPPVPAGPSEPEVAAGASEPERADREEPPDAGPSVAAPAAGGAGEEGEEEAVSGRAGAAGEEREAAEEGEEERRERAALLEELGGLAAERERLRQTSARRQLRLAELLRLRQGERRPRAEPESDGPEPYGRRLQQLQELREREVAASRERVAARRRAGEERQARARAEWAAFQARKKEVAVSSLGRRLGGREAAAAAVRIQAREEEKEQQVHEARVENIKLKHEIQILETILKAKGELVESQHVMRFELTKRENQKHSEKIDDLCDEILKLKKKVSTTACILSQFREKVEFVEAENRGRKAELMEIETILSRKRDVLTKTKQARDRLWRSNLKLQQKCGLLGNEILLRDYEEKVDTIELLSQRLETLKHHHAGLILTCRGIQKKIKEASFSFLAEDDLRKESMKKK